MRISGLSTHQPSVPQIRLADDRFAQPPLLGYQIACQRQLHASLDEPANGGADRPIAIGQRGGLQNAGFSGAIAVAEGPADQFGLSAERPPSRSGCT